MKPNHGGSAELSAYEDLSAASLFASQAEVLNISKSAQKLPSGGANQLVVRIADILGMSGDRLNDSLKTLRLFRFPFFWNGRIPALTGSGKIPSIQDEMPYEGTAFRLQI
jgi:hypothetical protein